MPPDGELLPMDTEVYYNQSIRAMEDYNIDEVMQRPPNVMAELEQLPPKVIDEIMKRLRGMMTSLADVMTTIKEIKSSSDPSQVGRQVEQIRTNIRTLYLNTMRISYVTLGHGMAKRIRSKFLDLNKDIEKLTESYFMNESLTLTMMSDYAWSIYDKCFNMSSYLYVLYCLPKSAANNQEAQLTAYDVMDQNYLVDSRLTGREGPPEMSGYVSSQQGMKPPRLLHGHDSSTLENSVRKLHQRRADSCKGG